MGSVRILHITSPEHGQSNVHLAVIASLRQNHGKEVDIHLASFESFRSRVPDGVPFHPILGKRLTDNFRSSDGADTLSDAVTTTPGFLGAVRGIMKMASVLHAEPPDEYLATAKSIEALIDALNPTLVVVENFLDAARDAVVRKQQPYVLLTPNTLKEVAAGDQGWGLFSWPAPAAGYPYPLPAHLRLPNALLFLFFPLWLHLFDAPFRRLNAARRAAGYGGDVPIFAPRDPAAPVLCMSHARADYAAVVPPGVVCCGPILQASAPVQDVDPALAAWLEQEGRRTVLVVLGSLLRLDAAYAQAVAGACRALLEARKDVQVLWKLQRAEGGYELGGLEEMARGDRFRVVEWLRPDPLAMLQTERVVCFVNHGGSNSYHEALSTATPQVILSPWYDCHDFGNRAEWLGVGKWGNKKSAPRCNREELTASLLTVVGNTMDDLTADGYRKRAKEISDLVMHRDDASGGMREGRDIAAEVIWQKAQEVLSL